MNVHFIAIGGSAMHHLAIAMKKKGFVVSGSDDAFFDPSKSNLQKHGLLPAETGWFPEKINKNIDALILGMHARNDNPELLEAKRLGVKIFSYPEYLYEQTKNKQRIVVGGSHGKTTTTLMIMHVLKHANLKFDYMAGATAEEFPYSVSLSDDSTLAVFEGDEYLTSPIDLVPKFHHYYPDVAIVTGIAWDHMNVFPTFEFYVEQFRIFTERITKNGTFIWFSEDVELQKLATQLRSDIQSIPYNSLAYEVVDGCTYLVLDGRKAPLEIFGAHNLQNLHAAYFACKQVGVSDTTFLQAISSFKGANKRLQKLHSNNNAVAYLDFAHSPSKVKATVDSVKAQFPDKTIVACFELHTFSSLSKEFLPQYKDALHMADRAYVYYSPDVVAHKKLESISQRDIPTYFNRPDLGVLTSPDEMRTQLLAEADNEVVYLFMTSGNFGGTDLNALSEELLVAKDK